MDKVTSYKPYYKYIKKTLSFVFKDKRIKLTFLYFLIFLIVSILTSVSIPLLLKKIIEVFSSPDSIPFALFLLGYGFIWVTSQVSMHLRSLFAYKIEQRITHVLGSQTISHLYNLSYHHFLSQKPGELTNIIRKAQQNVSPLILGIFSYVLPTIFEFLFAIILISYFYPLTYSLMMTIIFGMFIFYTIFSTKAVLKTRQDANEIDKNADGTIIDWISNYEAVKIFSRHDFASQICDNELKKKEIAEVAFMTKLSTTYIGQSLILGIGLTFLIYLIGKKVLEGQLTIGDFALFNGYVLQFIAPMNILGRITQEIKKALVDLKGVMGVLLSKNIIEEASHPLHLSDSSFHVCFHKVSFKYEERSILKDISFKIAPGETALLIGPTGIGKSTIAKLLLRLYDPTEGQIFINDINIKEISFQSLYETVSWIPQENYLLNDTIENNIRFVKPEASLPEIVNALERAELLDFIKNLPQGINTLVGNRGLKLSGGEKQRLSLARLFLKKPKICIFDESTASLDRNTEKIIQDNIEKEFKTMTKIIITHHPAANYKADIIINLEKSDISLKSSFNGVASNQPIKNVREELC